MTGKHVPAAAVGYYIRSIYKLGYRKPLHPRFILFAYKGEEGYAPEHDHTAVCAVNSLPISARPCTTEQTRCRLGGTTLGTTDTLRSDCLPTSSTACVRGYKTWGRTPIETGMQTAAPGSNLRRSAVWLFKSNACSRSDSQTRLSLRSSQRAASNDCKSSAVVRYPTPPPDGDATDRLILLFVLWLWSCELRVSSFPPKWLEPLLLSPSCVQ